MAEARRISAKPLQNTAIHARGGLLQRQCACGNHTHGGGECESCKKKHVEGLEDRLLLHNAVEHVAHGIQSQDWSTRASQAPRAASSPGLLYGANSGDPRARRGDEGDTRIPWSWSGAGVGALGGAVGGAIIGGAVGGLPGALIGAGIGAVAGGLAGGLIGGAGSSVIPTAIRRTQVDRDTPSLGPTYYGSVFKHTLSTSGGTITPDVTVAELVRVTRDDFATGFTGVPLGTLTWGPGGTAPLSGNDMFDNIGTNNINVTNFLPSPPKPGLPAVMETPQELHYRIGTGSWTKFADVPMVVTLRAKVGGGYEVETRNNSVPSLQNYTGPV